MLDEQWQGIFLAQLRRLIASAPSYASVEPPEQTASEITALFLDVGSVTVEETRARFVGEIEGYEPGDLEPMLGLIQLFSGAILALAEQDLSRENLGVTSVFRSAPHTSRYALIEISKAARSVLLLSSRGLDIQAVSVLRQAWEIAAQSIVLASNPDLGIQFDQLAIVGIDTIERDRLEQQFKDDLAPYRRFKLLSKIERDYSAQANRKVSAKTALRRFEVLYDDLSHYAHGGAYSAHVSEWSYFFRHFTLPDGVSGPAEGEDAWHFEHLVKQVFLLLDYFVWLYIAVEFASDDQGGMRRFFEDWLDFGQPVGGFEYEYQLYLALQALDQLGLEYRALILDAKD